jgi:hypothetical protein
MPITQPKNSFLYKTLSIKHLRRRAPPPSVTRWLSVTYILMQKYLDAAHKTSYCEATP